MQRFSSFDISELKLVYRVLHSHLMEHLELMDTDYLQDLQRWLQYRAGQDGVDTTDHGQWGAWLGDENVSAHVADRQVLTLLDD